MVWRCGFGGFRGGGGLEEGNRGLARLLVELPLGFYGVVKSLMDWEMRRGFMDLMFCGGNLYCC